MNPITYPIKPGTRGKKVKDLHEALLILIDRKREVFALHVPPAMTHVPRAPDWRKITAELKREREKAYYGKTTKWLVMNLQHNLHLPATGVVNEATARAINALLEAPGEERTFVVRGRVIGPELRGLSGWRVRAVDKNIAQDIVLGEATTGEGGAYEIRYSPGKIRRGKEKPDIQMLLLDRKGKVLAASKVRYNAGPEERGLDIVVPEEKLPRPPEFRRILDELAPQLGIRDEKKLKQRLAELKEDDGRQEITYLANKTGWDARMVAMMALAGRFSRRSRIEPEFYYALFRTGVPADEAALSRISPETVKRIWKQAIEQKILPSELREKIPRNLERFKAHSAGLLLEEPAHIGISNFKELIADVVRDEKKQQELARLYYERRDDLDGFWQEVTRRFGPEVADRLRLNGRLTFLTINNVPLIRRLHEHIGDLRDPLDLVQQGLYRKAKWEELLDDNVPVPDEIPGEKPEEKRSNYAAFLASQLRLSYPTAVVSEMVKAGEIPVTQKEAVAQFLDKHQGQFELGLHPVEGYLRRNNIKLKAPVLTELKRLQRVYQITPSDEAMGVLLKNNLDSAYAVVRYDQQSFLEKFQGELGGEAQARLLYHKAQQVHNAVLNLATSYFLESSLPMPYALGPMFPEKTGVLAYPTLEGLFGELDYCSCEHCRSWLSPAAYLVDLLLFLDKPHPKKKNPLEILQKHRPDIQHLQLTCENTKTVLPYIDLGNEVLEYWVVNSAVNGKNSLADFKGYNVAEGVSTEEILASPQFVNDRAYEILRDQRFPPPLPFHRSLEAQRRYFVRFEVPLHEAMERLRTNDNLERAGDLADKAYGWRDILMERLGLSRQEYEILTNSSIPLQTLYGEASSSVSVNQLINRLSKAKTYARQLNLTYEELIDIVRTQFINPHSHLLPKLEKLHINFATIQAFLDGRLSDDDLEARLPEDLDEDAYGGDVKQWLRDHQTQIMQLIVLSDPTGSKDVCSFDTVELRRFDHDRLGKVEFLKLLRFIRLWRKLGWSIEQTDKALKALYPADKLPAPEDDWETARAKLDDGFKTLLDHLAHLEIVMEQLNLGPERDLLPLLACWAPIDTHGYRSLYRRMFLNPTILALDPVFQEDGYGNYLADRREFREPGAELPKLADHAEALRAAFNLTGEEFDLIRQELGFGEEAVLNLANISALFRYGYLARQLRLSVRELLALKKLSGLDPFRPLDLASPDPAQPLGAVRPPAIRFIELAHRIKNSPFKVSALVYYLQHQDCSGKASPCEEDILAFARTLREDLLHIERENVVQEDPTGEISKARIALVYPQEAVDTFFGFLNHTITFSTGYDHGRPQLEEAILEVTNRIAYDDFRKELSFRGVMTEGERDALKGVPGVSQDFRDAVQALYDDGQEALADFFARYPELETPYFHFVSSSESVEKRFSALLAEILPDLLRRLKRQQIRQTVSAQVGADLTLVTPVLEDAQVLHAIERESDPAIMDFLALRTWGLSAEIFFTDDLGNTPDQSEVLPQIDYASDNTPLPSNPTDPNVGISGRWRGFLEAPDTGFYNFSIEADAGAEVALKLGGEKLALDSNNDVWENQEPIELQAGRLYAVELEIRRVKNRLSLKWKRRGMGQETVPAEHLYPATVVERFTATYLRVLKALAIAEAVGLSGEELAYFATHEDYRIDGEGWLNLLPVELLPAGDTVQALFGNLLALLRYRNLKQEMNIPDGRLLETLKDPEARDEEGVLLLERVTGWREDDLTALLGHFGLGLSDLGHLRHLTRLHEAMGIVKKLGIGAFSLISMTTNEPDADTLRDLQAALRARYDDTPGLPSSIPDVEEAPARRMLAQHRAWLKLIQPINDELRGLQRDALVAYVLHKLSQDEATKHIDTPDKLFEYLLIDVKMDPCMKTSRIKQAISSVQLFVQRCLMNLEPEVASSDIDAKQWEWMKRYRVWEANRKVFLWPENWLEPELRDNKSPFFRDLESGLLQGDITDDAAATALVHYLEKLDEVAKLEICGMYYEENELDNPADDVIHVIARTVGAQRTYYYRRQEGGITWTPWEKIDLNIEDNPVLPVVWKGRLFLFWLSVMQKAVPVTDTQDSGSKDETLTKVNLSDLRGSAGEPKTRISLTLYWSEYYNGKWQPPRTSDVNQGLPLGKFPPTGDRAFDRSKLTLRAYEAPVTVFKPFVLPSISTGMNFGVYAYEEELTDGLIVEIGYDLQPAGYFQLFNSYSLPLFSKSYGVAPKYPGRRLLRADRFKIVYCTSSDTCKEKVILSKTDSYVTVEPGHPVKNIFAPFFFQDWWHVFFVRSERSKIRVPEFGDILVLPPMTKLPDLIMPPTLTKPEYVPPEDSIFPLDPIMPGVVDSGPVESFMRDEPYIFRTIGMTGTVRFEGRLIGPGGSMLHERRFR